ncbi:MAG TPA: porin [Alphaproteobacteria bacterium]|nr:porin [Alphaproteobacteria bacterium]
MTRYLLGSTALLSAVIFNVYANAAETKPTPTMAVPQLKISGQTSFNSLFFRNKKIFKNDPQLQDVDIDAAVCGREKFGRGQLFTVDNSKLKFNVDGKTDPGMEYGLVFVIDGNVDAGKSLKENYIYFGGMWGKILAGDTYGVEHTMGFGGFTEWGGTGFLDGGVLDRVVNFTTGTLHSVDLEGDTSRDTKLTYFTPRWKGLQLGVSYTPRTEHRGQQIIESRRSVVTPKKPWDSDSIASGINFIHKFTSGFEVGLSATSVFGKAHSEFSGSLLRKNTASYAFGGTMSYKGVGFGAEFGNNNRSHSFKEGGHKSNAGRFLDFGLSYKWCPSLKLSAGLYYAWRRALAGGFERPLFMRKAKTKGITAAIDKKLAPGLGLYAEYAYLQMRNPAAIAEQTRINKNLAPCKQKNGAVTNNHANVFILGTRLVF